MGTEMFKRKISATCTACVVNQSTKSCGLKLTNGRKKSMTHPESITQNKLRFFGALHESLRALEYIHRC